MSNDQTNPCQGCAGSTEFPNLPTYLVQYPSGGLQSFWTEESANEAAALYGGKVVAIVVPGEEAKGYQFLDPEDAPDGSAQEPVNA